MCMFIENREYLDTEFDDIIVDELSECDELDAVADSELYFFSADIHSILQDIINREDELQSEYLKEAFVNQTVAESHFNRHCKGGLVYKSGKGKETRHNVYYDFATLDDYLKHENKVSKVSKRVIDNKTNMCINDNKLFDYNYMYRTFRRLFKGKACLVFDTSCGFQSRHFTAVRLVINAYTTENTKDYKYNTIDILIQTPNYETISLYAIDASLLESKINNEFKKYQKFDKYKDINYKINH